MADSDKDMQALAAALSQLAGQGRGGDSMLAHINPQEAELLKAVGGSGAINPKTGLREFQAGPAGDGNADAASGKDMGSESASGGGNNDDLFGGLLDDYLSGAPVQESLGPNTVGEGQNARSSQADAKEFNDSWLGGLAGFFGFSQAGSTASPTASTQFSFDPIGFGLGLVSPGLGLAYSGMKELTGFNAAELDVASYNEGTGFSFDLDDSLGGLGDFSGGSSSGSSSHESVRDQMDIDKGHGGLDGDDRGDRQFGNAQRTNTATAPTKATAEKEPGDDFGFIDFTPFRFPNFELIEAESQAKAFKRKI